MELFSTFIRNRTSTSLLSILRSFIRGISLCYLLYIYVNRIFGEANLTSMAKMTESRTHTQLWTNLTLTEKQNAQNNNNEWSTNIIRQSTHFRRWRTKKICFGFSVLSISTPVEDCFVIFLCFFCTESVQDDSSCWRIRCGDYAFNELKYGILTLEPVPLFSY